MYTVIIYHMKQVCVTIDIHDGSIPKCFYIRRKTALKSFLSKKYLNKKIIKLSPRSFNGFDLGFKAEALQ